MSKFADELLADLMREHRPVLQYIQPRTVAVRRRARSRPIWLTASAIAVAAAAVALSVNGVRPDRPANTRVVTTALVYSGPLTGPAAHNPAAVLRMLANKAAAQPTPALGPVLYSKTAIWGLVRSNHGGLDFRSRDFRIQQQWISAGAQYFTVTNPYGKASPGFVPSGYSKIDPRHNQFWHWINPATLPASPAALQRRLLENPIWGGTFTLMETAPLRPAVRASLLRLMAGDFQRSGDIVLGTVTDPAGRRGIAIASSTRGRREGFVDTVVIDIFDAATGALIGVEDASCNGQINNLAEANARCQRVSYEQFLVIKAVRAMPRPSLTRGPWTTARFPSALISGSAQASGPGAGNPAGSTSRFAGNAGRGAIAGTVTGGGKRLGGVCVVAYHPGIGVSHRGWVKVRTSATGHFRIAKLPRGRYTVAFANSYCGNDGNWLPQFYKGINGPHFQNGDVWVHRPTMVRVIAGLTTRGIDAALQRGGQISGTVRSQSGKALPRVCAFALGKDGRFMVEGGSSSGRNGRYEIHSLFPGKYTVHFGTDGACGDAGNYAEQWWRDSSTPEHARTIVIKYGLIVRHVDAALHPAA